MSLVTDQSPERASAEADSFQPVSSASRGRPSWSGLLRLSLVSVPVKAYPALNTSAAIHFNQLHADCGQRIQYQKHCPVHGVVDQAAITRGYQYAPDQYVVVEPEELEKTRPAKDKALILEHYLPQHHVDPVLYAGRSLYLLPDGPAARHPYSVVAEALHQGQKWALGQAVLSGHRHLIVVRPQRRLLVMDLLHYPAEVRGAGEETAPKGDPVSNEELRLATTIIDNASGPVDWSRYRDATAEELTALIEAKVGGRPLAAAQDEPVAVLQLLDALKQSVASLPDTSKPKKPNAKSRKPPAQRRTA
jgi:DNA end-binding protein Ku